MSFTATTERRTVAGQTYDVCVLANLEAGCRAEIWPAFGANCLSWQSSVGGRTHELLYSPSPVEIAERPTRGGVPVLFPFPNRIRAGRFQANGRGYTLPLNDSTNANAIHGFAPRRPWRTLELKADDKKATARFVFQMSRDVPNAADLWPGDALLTLAISLRADSLRYEATVENAGEEPLPFGLGYHPYFRCTDADVLTSFAEERWELADNLPTGQRVPVDGDFDLGEPKPVGQLKLDDVFCNFAVNVPPIGGQLSRANLLRLNDGVAVIVWTDPDFENLVLFTPPHRQAVAIEPYTCATDAPNLSARGIDSGWKTLEPGKSWSGRVTYSVHPMDTDGEAEA